jgi:penicillin-binding protein 1A
MKDEVLEENFPFVEMEEEEEREEAADSPSPSSKEPVISPQNAFIMTHLLQGVVQHGTGQRAKTLGRAVAGKTGTSSDYADAWFVGYTPGLLTTVWVGFDDKTSLGKNETGARAALPIWITFMDQALKKSPHENFKVPKGITLVKVNLESGLPADGETKETIMEAFVNGNTPWGKEIHVKEEPSSGTAIDVRPSKDPRDLRSY